MKSKATCTDEFFSTNWIPLRSIFGFLLCLDVFFEFGLKYPVSGCLFVEKIKLRSWPIAATRLPIF
jgi:hypothetical protein